MILDHHISEHLHLFGRSVGVPICQAPLPASHHRQRSRQIPFFSLASSATTFECLIEIRSTDYLKHLSVAIYSTSSTEHDIEESLIYGTNFYIRKPSDFDELKAILNKVVTTNLQYHSSDLDKENFVMVI